MMLLLLVGQSTSLPTVNQDGLVLSVSGEGRIERPGAQPVPLVAGEVLPQGTLVCTGEDSFATVRLAVDPEARVHDDISLLEETCMVVASMTTTSTGDIKSVVDIQQGSVSVRLPEHGHGQVTVRTVDGASNGEGGFRVHVEPSASRTEALYAPVDVVGDLGELRLDAGQGTRVTKGQAPQAPVQLLLPGTPVLPENDAILGRADFSWSPVDRALTYQVEVSLTPGFDDLVIVEEVSGPAWNPELLFVPYRVPGMWWRVSSIDRTGFQGVPSDPRRLVHPAGTGL